MDWRVNDEIYIPSAVPGGGIRIAYIAAIEGDAIYVNLPGVGDMQRMSAEELTALKAFKTEVKNGGD